MPVVQELGLAAAKQPLPMQCAINLDNGLSVLISLLWTVFHSEVRVNHFYEQRAKKVVSNSLGLVDFAIGLMNYVLNLPDGQVMLFEQFE